MDYGKDTEFEVISILEGTVISVKEDDSLKEILADHQQMVKDSTPVPKDYKQTGFYKRLCAVIKIISALL